MALPWEDNPWLKSVFGEEKEPLDLPTIYEPPENIAWPQPTGVRFQSTGLPLGSKRRKTRKPWVEEVDDPRQQALQAWLRIIRSREQ
eukprot:2609367-Amphidinium_carterae.1